MRRRDTYYGGSTILIPGKDGSRSELPPIKALEQARMQNELLRQKSVDASDEGLNIMLDVYSDIFEVTSDLAKGPRLFGQTLVRLNAINWRERLNKSVKASRDAQRLDRVKAAQALMRRLQELERELGFNASWPEDARYDDRSHWLNALYAPR